MPINNWDAHSVFKFNFILKISIVPLNVSTSHASLTVEILKICRFDNLDAFSDLSFCLIHPLAFQESFNLIPVVISEISIDAPRCALLTTWMHLVSVDPAQHPPQYSLKFSA